MMASFARPSPISRASRCVPPLPGIIPSFDLGERELDVVGGEPEVARERELEADAEGVAAQLRDHGLGAALRSGDVPGEARERLGLGLEEPGDVSSRAERAARSRQDDDAHPFVLPELREQAAELVACLHRDPVQLARHVERDRRHAALVVPLDAEAVVLRHELPTCSPSRSSRRRIFPDGLFGSSSTNRYSRGRLKRASASEARHQASSSSAVTSPSGTTQATTR